MATKSVTLDKTTTTYGDVKASDILFFAGSKYQVKSVLPVGTTGYVDIVFHGTNDGQPYRYEAVKTANKIG